MRINRIKKVSAWALLAGCLLAAPTAIRARIYGVTGTTFNLTAKADYLVTGDGNSVYFWGYANGTGRAQYPGPTVIVDQGDTVTINLANTLPVPVSIVFPGQEGVIATGDADGLMTKEANASNGAARYTFVAAHPGTYLYHSGTNPDLQVEMGLTGVIIVRPSMGPNFAYNDAATRFDREYLFFESEMDPRIHHMVEIQGVAALAATNYLSDYFSNYWFLNGRTGPDTLQRSNAGWLATQPYGSLARMHPHEKILMRLVGGNRDMHPFHHHGNHARVVAEDGRLLQSAPGAGIDLSYQVFSVQTHPGQTLDAFFEWTGQNLGWDMYGTTAASSDFRHQCAGKWDDDPNPSTPNTWDPATGEWCADHGKRLPVVLPENQNLEFGAFYSGSPFLGRLGPLPPGTGGFDPTGGYAFMWHSHTEKELTNWDIFPGGMMTFMIVEAPGVTITE